jgi:hypothetical protein
MNKEQRARMTELDVSLTDEGECCHEFVPFQPDCTKCGIPYKPASQPHGEPVAKLNWEQIVGLVNEVLGCDAHKWPMPDVGHEMTGINFNSLARIIDRVQAEQPAPVAVVLPERREPTQDNPYLSDADHEWNAYRDELKRLNPSL